MSPLATARDRSQFIRILVVLFGAVALLLSLAPSASAAGTFADDDNSVHESDIEWIAARDITQGCNPPTNNRYCPDDDITRGQMAAYLKRALDLGSAPSADFADTRGSTFEADIDAIARTGVTKGCNPPTNDRYCPDQVVTRGQLAAFLTRAFDLSSAGDNYFHDDSGSTFEDDINAVAAAGITVGCGDGRYCPDDSVTREQMASFIKRAIAGGITPPNPQPNPSPPGTLPAPGDSKPAGAVVVNPGQNLSQMVSSRPGNTTFYLTKGTHRLEGVTPKSGNEFVGAPGAVMSGAKVLTNFTKDGNHWVASGQTQQNERHGTCEGGNACTYPEQLFFDNVEFRQVTSRGAVKAGTWYFDYGANKIFIANDPNGHLVETSVTDHAFIGDANNVTIRDLTIEKYASPANMGAIHGRSWRNGPHNQNWKVIGNEVRFNASNGIHFGDKMVVRENYVHHNGRLGLSSSESEDALAERNEVSYNCVPVAEFQCFGWGGGGVKIAGPEDAVLRSNYVHHNYGHGMHDDVGATGTLYENNRVANNYGHGIFIEISFDATVRDNEVTRNGYGRPQGRGGGVQVESSRGVVVTGNQLTNNAASIIAKEVNRPPNLHNLSVTGNTVSLNEGFTGLRTNGGSLNWNSRGIVWNNNTYDINGVSNPFRLNATAWLSINQWRGQGYDNGSNFK